MGLLAAMLAWRGLSQYRAARQADAMVAAATHTAALQAQQAAAEARQRSAELAATLRRQREETADTHRVVAKRAAQYQVELARREEERRREAERVKASYRLGPDQSCAGNIVINRHASSYTQALGKSGQPIACVGAIAAEPLR